MPFYISHRDITTMEVDAIVNAANTELREGGGVCGAIFLEAGRKEMTDACQKIGHISTGGAAITPGFRLPAKYVIHTAGPIWTGSEEDERLLYLCYEKSLFIAFAQGLTTVAFPLISSGIYGCPRPKAFSIAKKSILNFLGGHPDMTVYLILLDPIKDPVKQKTFEALQKLLRHHLMEEEEIDHLRKCMELQDREEASDLLSPTIACGPRPYLDEEEPAFPIPLAPSFTEMLFHLIDARGLTDPTVYKAANLDRRLFSKMRSPGKHYTPKKENVLALAVALRLPIKETEALLETAGYSLSRSKKLDLIVRWFIEQERYDIYEINEMLERFGEKQLGG